MIEELAFALGRSVSRETSEKLENFVALVVDENKRQNLIATSTIKDAWVRHLLDSAQLMRFAPEGHTRRWLDVGSGAGFPGLVLALLSGEPTTLVEPRRLRADFLQRCAVELKLENVEVICAKAERLTGKFDVITARAVAAVDKLLAMTWPLSHRATRWILPKGRSGAKELAEAQRSWQGRFSVERSITDEAAVILLAEGVKPRGGASR